MMDKMREAMTHPDDTEPSAEAMAADIRKAVANISTSGGAIYDPYPSPLSNQLSGRLLDLIAKEAAKVALLALDRFRAAGVREWQPIETIPNDVRADDVVLLWKPDERRSGASRFVGYWDDQASGWMPVYGSYVVENVTHWMPLPEPPHDR